MEVEKGKNLLPTYTKMHKVSNNFNTENVSPSENQEDNKQGPVTDIIITIIKSKTNSQNIKRVD